MNNKRIIKQSIIPVLSVIMVLFYFMPWIVYDFGEWSYENSRTALGFNLLGMLYFLTAWVQIPVNIVFIIIRRKNKSKQKFHIINLIVLILYCTVVFIGMANGKMVTV